MTQVVVGIADDVVDQQLVRVDVNVAVEERITIFIRAREVARQSGFAHIHQIVVAANKLQLGGNLGHIDP